MEGKLIDLIIYRVEEEKYYSEDELFSFTDKLGMQKMPIEWSNSFIMGWTGDSLLKHKAIELKNESV